MRARERSRARFVGGGEPSYRRPHYSPAPGHPHKGDRMASRRTVIAISAAVVAVAAWYAFRPERLFVNKTVSESFPAASVAQAAVPTAPTRVASGRFHTNAHETKGLAAVYRLRDCRNTVWMEGIELYRLAPRYEWFASSPADGGHRVPAKDSRASAGVLDRDERSPYDAGAFVLSETRPGAHRVSVRGGGPAAGGALLRHGRQQGRAAGHRSRGLLQDAAGGVLRESAERTGDRGAVCGFALDPGVLALRVGGADAAPFELYGDPPAARPRGLRGGVRLAAAGFEEEEAAQRPAPGDRHVGARGKCVVAVVGASADGGTVPPVREAASRRRGGRHLGSASRERLRPQAAGPEDQ